MKSENDLDLVRETVRLLENVPFKDWPTFEAEPAACVRVDIPLEDPTKPPSPEVAAKLAELKATLKRIDNDLALQAGHVRVALEEVRQGRTKAFIWPDAPMRVAILLRKRGEGDLERRFLAAFLKRLPNGTGYRARKLIERLEKLSSSPA